MPKSLLQIGIDLMRSPLFWIWHRSLRERSSEKKKETKFFFLRLFSFLLSWVMEQRLHRVR